MKEIIDDLTRIHSQIEEILNEYFDCNIEKIKSNRNLYHYTTLSGLMSIIKHDQIWITDRDYVNDKLDKNYSKNIIEKQFKEINITNIFDEIYNIFVPKKEYVFCMSSENDLIHQWQYYGKNDGYAIGFSTDKLLDEVMNNKINYVVGKILYDEKLQIDFLKKIIEIIMEVKEKFANLGGAYSDYFGPEHALSSAYSLMKSKHHECEKEIRITLFQNTYGEINPKIKENYRPGNGMVIPYYNFKFKNKLPIKSITIGPSIEQDIAERSLRSFLEKYNYNNVEILKSKIRIR